MIKLNEIKENYLEILVIFFGSLLSFYFPVLYNLRVFDFVSFAILLFLVNQRKNNIYIGNTIKSFFLLFTIFIVLSFLVSILNKAVEIHLPRIIGTFFAIIFSILFYGYFKNRVSKLIIGIKYTIYIHAIFFYIQFLLFFLLKQYVDFIKPITGNVSRNIGGSFNLDSAIRSSGLYSEPASYSLFILSLMSAYILYKKRIDLIDFIVLFSVILSASASGTVYLIAFIFVYFIIYSNTALTKKVYFASLVTLGAFFFIGLDYIKVDYLFEKIINFEDSGSYQYRIGNTNEVLSELTDLQQYFGVGYANMDIKGDKGSTYSALFIEHGYILGGFFMVIILSFFISHHIKIPILFYVLLLFMGTHTYAQIQFWIWILSIAIISTNLYNNERKNLQVIT
ncbi:hypothetical protein [Flavobacterium sp. JP2137]|uniref:hypothetical protein n=1 Tax=Flavobacterium sp. JP2137 TaxID=3414510 RepID=UPI003D2FB257